MKKNIVIIILAIIVLGMGGYLVYDKVLSKKEVKEETSNENVVKDEKKKTKDELITLTFDSSKSLNTKDINYEISSDGISLGVSVYSSLENSQRKFYFSYGKETFDAYNLDYTSENSYDRKEFPYEENIIDIYVAGFGQAAGEETVFFLKSDGTVEYMPVYYALKNSDIRIYGKLEGVEKVIKFVSVSASDGFAGWHTTLAQRSDGTFYDLNAIIPKDKYYQIER